LLGLLKNQGKNPDLDSMIFFTCNRLKTLQLYGYPKQKKWISMTKVIVFPSQSFSKTKQTSNFFLKKRENKLLSLTI